MWAKNEGQIGGLQPHQEGEEVAEKLEKIEDVLAENS